MQIEKSILSTLAYFDLFEHPMSAREIFLFLQEKCSYSDFETSLELLLQQAVVYEGEGFYMIRRDHGFINKRRLANDRAQKLLVKAHRGARLIARFPFVRAVAISGSLSKNVAGEKSDIDYFIITAKDRLWISRSFLHLFKKLTFLVGRQHHYCMNYFISEDRPIIRETNIYTATEALTLIPVSGEKAFTDFSTANTWANSFLPNHTGITVPTINNTNRIKGFVENIFKNQLGISLEAFLMKLTTASWNRKAEKQKRNDNGHLMMLDSSPHYAKPSATQFQRILLNRFEARRKEVIEKYLETSKVEV